MHHEKQLELSADIDDPESWQFWGLVDEEFHQVGDCGLKSLLFH